MIPHVLTIAGSDSSGGAGIQADLKTFTSLKVYGCSIITALTAQNTQGVQAVSNAPVAMVRQQFDAIFEDIQIDAAKTGMLSTNQIISAVTAKLRKRPIRWLVVDPVMRAKGGDHLLRPSAVRTLKSQLLPLASLATPNIPEAETLIGRPIRNRLDMSHAARKICRMGPKSVLIKGGHFPGRRCIDILWTGHRFVDFDSPRIDTRNTHGTGCTLSAAIAAFLARGLPLVSAVREGKRYVTGAIESSFSIGKGHGPLNHFWRIP